MTATHTTQEGNTSNTINLQRGLQQSGAFEEDPEDIVGSNYFHSYLLLSHASSLHYSRAQHTSFSSHVGEKFRRGGDTWEEVILKQLDSAGHKVWKGEPPKTGSATARLSDAKIDFNSFMNILENLKPDEGEQEKRYFIYQPTLIAVPSFCESLGLQKSSISFSSCYPDFVEVSFEKTSSPDICTRHMHPRAAKAAKPNEFLLLHI